MLTLRRAEGREFDPRPGQYSSMSFSSDQVTGTVFLHLNMPFHPHFKFIENIVLVGKQKLQSISTFLYNIEVASHVKKLPFRPNIIILMYNVKLSALIDRIKTSIASWHYRTVDHNVKFRVELCTSLPGSWARCFCVGVR